MTRAEKLQKIAENEQKVFDAGKYKEWSDFWDAFQQNGARKSYQGGFYGAGWTDENFKPKYDIVNTINTASMFLDSKITDLDALIRRAGIKFSTATAIRMDSMFNAADVTVVPELDARNVTFSASLRDLFAAADQLHTVRKLIVNERCTYQNAFLNAKSLQNITFEGTIANDINLQQSPLSGESVLNILDHLYIPDGDEPLFLPYERTITLNDESWARAEAILSKQYDGDEFYELYGDIKQWVADLRHWNV